MASILNSDEIAKLVTIVEEAARSTDESVKYFVEPAPGTLNRSTSKRHHLIFGRRGSGKSSLLNKAASELTTSRRPIALVNLEVFKGHSHPDVLLSVLIKTFSKFKDWMETAAVHPANKKTFWSLFGKIKPTRKPLNKLEADKITESLRQAIDELKELLHEPVNSSVSISQSTETEDGSSASAQIDVNAKITKATIHGDAQTREKQVDTQNETYKKSKIDFLHRKVIEYQEIFDRIGRLSNGDAFLFLDDLYHIKRSDQARVIDYFHRIAKDNHLWLKIGTIRHRSTWYVHGDPSIGMKIGDDADEIDLDVTLEKYSIAKKFLKSILTNFSNVAGIKDADDFITDGALNRLVLASGGVARDFLSIFRRSVDDARERDGGPRGYKVTAEDVNVASGNYDSSKREEFRRDTSNELETESLEGAFNRVREFCLTTNNTNCFLLDKDSENEEIRNIKELVDLKLIHLARSRVTVSGRPGKIYEAYMLDLSQYAGSRKRRNLNLIEFWQDGAEESLRKASLIYQ